MKKRTYDNCFVFNWTYGVWEPAGKITKDFESCQLFQTREEMEEYFANK